MPNVFTVDGDAVIYDTPGGTVVAVDVFNQGSPLDGIVDYVFIAQRETKLAAAPRRSNVHIEFWGDSFRLLETDRKQAIDFALAEAQRTLKAMPPDWSSREARDAFGISASDVRAENVSLDLVVKGDGTSAESQKADDYGAPWFLDPSPNPGGGADTCSSGGPGATSCSTSCGYGSLNSSCTVSCSRGTYACCRCDYIRALCTCQAG